MSNIEDIRQKFPQYNDMDDATLVQALHRRFYADMPFETFVQRVGYQPPEGGLPPAVPGTPQASVEAAYREGGAKADRARENQWLSQRGPIERAGDAAAFVASAPVRMLTRGQYGAGDVLGAVGAKGAAASANQAEQDFVRANPDLIWTLGAAGEVTAGIPALNTMSPGFRGPGQSPRQTLRRAVTDMRSGQALDDMESFERSRVPQFAPAFMNQPMQNTAQGLADTIVVGTPLRNAADDATMAAANRAQEVARSFGRAEPPAATARRTTQALERYRNERLAPLEDLTPDVRAQVMRQPSRHSSIKTKQDVAYDRAWSFIPEEMRDGRSVRGQPRLMVQFPTARALLRDIQNRNSRMTIQSGQNNAGQARVIASGGFVSDVLEALMSDRYTANLQTARNTRSEIRRMVSSLPENERNALSRADLRRLESALTQDIVAGLTRYRDANSNDTNLVAQIDRSIRGFRRADQFTRAAAGRIEDAKRLFQAPDEMSLYRGIVNAARSGDVQKLRALRKSLTNDDLGEISSTLVNEMGRPIASARGTAEEMGFSVNTFATNWNKMVESNPASINLLFPDQAHRQALTDLARVVDRLSNVESMRNTSRSATTAANLGVVGATGAGYALLDPVLVTGALGSLAATRGMASLMASPATTRWMATYIRLRANAVRNPDTQNLGWQLRDHVARLSALAANEAIPDDVVENVVNDNASIIGAGRFAAPVSR